MVARLSRAERTAAVVVGSVAVVTSFASFDVAVSASSDDAVTAEKEGIGIKAACAGSRSSATRAAGRARGAGDAGKVGGASADNWGFDEGFAVALLVDVVVRGTDAGLEDSVVLGSHGAVAAEAVDQVLASRAGSVDAGSGDGVPGEPVFADAHSALDFLVEGAGVAVSVGIDELVRPAVAFADAVSVGLACWAHACSGDPHFSVGANNAVSAYQSSADGLALSAASRESDSESGLADASTGLEDLASLASDAPLRGGVEDGSKGTRGALAVLEDESIQTFASRAGFVVLLVGGTSLTALAVHNLRPRRAFALASVGIVGGVEGTGDAVAVEEEEVASTQGADALVVTIAGPALASFGGGVVVLVDSAGEDAVAVDEDGPVVALAADSLADFPVAADAHADSVSPLAVGRADVAEHAPVVGVIDVVGVADAEDAVEVAVGGTGVMRRDAVLVLFDEPVLADTNSALEEAVVGAHVDGTALSLRVSDEAFFADALVVKEDFVFLAVLGGGNEGRVDGSDDGDSDALSTRVIESEADSAGALVACPIGVEEVGTALGVPGGLSGGSGSWGGWRLWLVGDCGDVGVVVGVTWLNNNDGSSSAWGVHCWSFVNDCGDGGGNVRT